MRGTAREIQMVLDHRWVLGGSWISDIKGRTPKGTGEVTLSFIQPGRTNNFTGDGPQRNSCLAAGYFGSSVRTNPDYLRIRLLVDAGGKTCHLLSQFQVAMSRRETHGIRRPCDCQSLSSFSSIRLTFHLSLYSDRMF